MVNLSQKLKFKNQKSGFTLVEVLVVVGILVIIMVAVSTIFFTTTRSSTKTKIVTKVKENGDYALSVMERLIRDSQEIIENSDGKLCESDMKKLKVKRLDGTEIEFACVDAGGENGYIASNSANLTSPQIVKLNSCSFDCSCPPVYPNCVGEGTKLYPKTITIKFTLTQPTATVRPEEEAKVDFQTTVSTRNY